MTPRNNEDVVYAAVERGELHIDAHGRIWRRMVRRGRVSATKIKERRAETVNTCGYLQVASMEHGRRVRAMAHRLVWRHFRGPIPSGLTINHIDGHTGNNAPENLELATYAQNILHARATGRDYKGDDNPRAVLTDTSVADIRARRAAGETVTSLAKAFGIGTTQVSRICRRESWGHL